jgi:glutamine amidotransferase
MKKIAIIDYGLGNLRSVARGLEKAGAVPAITEDPEEIAAADGLVLPGVGAFHEGMEQLSSVRDAIMGSVRGNIPLLGICLGMQMLLETSEEHGLHEGLSLIPGHVRKFPRTEGYKIPHMGWNTLVLIQEDNPLFEGFRQDEFVYFVHSYYVDTSPEYTLTETDYICRFASSVSHGMTFGVQFHPEKSGTTGLRLLKNFISLV